MMSDSIRPIFVLGAAHSGTTILYRMLAMHPDVTWFSQFSQRSGTIPHRFRLPFCHQLDRLLRTLFPFDWRKEEGRVRRLFVPRPGEANRIWEYIFPNTGDISHQESVHRMREVFEKECRLWRRSYLIVKLPRLYKHIHDLHTAFPEGRFIHIVRDGRAVALSDRHKFMRRGESQLEGLCAAAQYWLDVVQEVDRQKERVRLFEIRYEDFCRDVHQHVREILRWLGLDEEKFPFHRCPKSLKVTNKKWLRSMTLEEKKVLHKLQHKYLEKYGYST